MYYVNVSNFYGGKTNRDLFIIIFFLKKINNKLTWTILEIYYKQIKMKSKLYRLK